MSTKPTLPTEVIELLPRLEAALGLQTVAGKAVLTVFLENAILMDKKQRDYGPRNISIWGLPGIAMRLTDKVERIATLLKGKRRRPQNESLEDSFKDACVYGAIAQVFIRGQWPLTEIAPPPTPKPKVPWTSEKVDIANTKSCAPIVPQSHDHTN